MDYKCKKIDYSSSAASVNLQRAVLCAIPVAISLFVAIINLPFPYGSLAPLLYLLFSVPFWYIKFKNIKSQPWEYFESHSWLLKRPKELTYFQIENIKDHGIKIETNGSFTHLMGYNCPLDIIIENLVYRYTKQPAGVRYEWTRDRNSFWSQHDAWVYVGTKEQVQPQEIFEIRKFTTGLLNEEKWYYIQCNSSGYSCGFMYINLCYAIGAFINEEKEDYDELFVDDLLETMEKFGGTWDEINPDSKDENDKIKIALYFKNETGAQQAKEWLESRWTMKTLFQAN